MSAYVKIATGEYPRHEGDIRLEHPEILESQTGDTFPCPPTYALVEYVDPPVFDYATHRVQLGTPELVNGVWKMTWVIRPATQEEIDYKDPVIFARPSLDQPGAEPDVID